MVSKAEAIIYLADQRRCSEAAWFRSYYTLDFRELPRQNRTRFGSLVAVDEHTLKEGRTLLFEHTKPLKILLIPVTGALNYRHDRIEKTVDVGQTLSMMLPPGIPLVISNFYLSSSIRFLQVHMSIGSEMLADQDCIATFELAEGRRELSALTTTFEELSYIGKLRGRKDVVYQRKLQRSGIFIYQISGTCEVNGRLLLPGDALSLTNIGTIECEALTYEAIVFVTELPLS